MTEKGEVLSTVQIENDPIALSLAIAEAGPDPEVALESTYGWYWAADLLQAEGARVHLIHPLGLHWDTGFILPPWCSAVRSWAWCWSSV
jgi:hypothetical protein